MIEFLNDQSEPVFLRRFVGWVMVMVATLPILVVSVWISVEHREASEFLARVGIMLFAASVVGSAWNAARDMVCDWRELS